MVDWKRREEKRKEEEEETGGQATWQTSTPEINSPFGVGGETRAQQSRLAAKVGSSFAIGSVVVVPRCRTGRPVVWG